ncbi:hypothetical protein BGW39_010159 [Mortierella sp. 14UC]|nr:hypothetical protein BGW39_010159 [Mortierella sp. 14UC]
MSIAQKTRTGYEDIKGIALVDFLDVDTERSLSAHELWKDQATVVIVIRRPGCQFCREEARIFDAQRHTIENDMAMIHHSASHVAMMDASIYFSPLSPISFWQQQGIKMVCIVHEKEGADIFQKEFWHGKVYFDEQKDFYKALGSNGHLRTGGWGQLVRPSFWGNLIRNKKSGVKGNFIGDGSILGGLLLVQQGDQGIAYEHIEKVWGDIARADRVLEACSRVSGVSLGKEKVQQAHQEHQALHDKMQASPLAAGQGHAASSSSSSSGPAAAAAPSACALPSK